MALTSAVPRPTFGDRGFVAPDESAILTGVQTDINTALGGGVDPNLSTPQGQIAQTETAIIGDKNASFIWFTNQVDPAFNSGRMQDAIGRIYFIDRFPGKPTVIQAICSGLNGVIIPIGVVAQAQDDNLYVCQQQGTIVNGSVTLEFACAQNGPIPCPADSGDWKIYQGVFGWDGLTTAVDGVLGRDEETPSEFETRRSQSVAHNSVAMLDSILGTVLSDVDGVLDAVVLENNEDSPQSIGGQFLGPHSIYVCVLGGTDDDVANAIWRKKGPGAGYNGDTEVTVFDPNPSYVPPIPSYVVRFQRPDIIGYAALVKIQNTIQVPTNAPTLIADAVTAAFAGEDGGPRAKIGSTILASRYYAPVAVLGTWARIIEILIGRLGDGAQFTASIAGTVMTVTAKANGTLAAGQLVSVADSNTIVLSGTLIVNQLTGPTGGTGTYTVSLSQTVTSRNIVSSVIGVEDTAALDESPTILSGNVQTQLTT